MRNLARSRHHNSAQIDPYAAVVALPASRDKLLI
jgi:hypothetical protein